MVPLLFKYRQACLLALCALLGLACGNLAATFLGVRLWQETQPSPVSIANRPGPASDETADLAYILQHNLFVPTARTKAAPAFSLQLDDGGTGKTAARTDVELIGMVAAGERSIAVLRAGQETRTYRLGEDLPGGGKIEEITRHQVKIRNANQSITTLTMHEGERTAPADRPSRTVKTGSIGEVRAVGENRWVIPRAMAESVRGNLGEQLRMAQMQPRIVDGRTDGFVIQKITMGTPLSQMGLKRGDVLKRVNSMTIDSPEKALQILQQLREARQLNVDLERDGKTHSFAYAIE